MPEQKEVEVYNYAEFPGGDSFLAFRTLLPVGFSAPDFQAVLLDTGQPVQISEYWKKGYVLIEFGSLTWPYCALAAPALESTAQRFTPTGFTFVFVYTREAHPGEHFPSHRSFEQKLAHALAFKEKFGIGRPILVDDLIGTGHKLYGALPNMTYLIGRSGKVLFRADWTDAPTIETVLNYVLSSRARRREGLRLAPFYAEFVGYRWNDPQKFQEGLARAGQKAVADFARATERRKKEGPRPGRIELPD